MEKKAITLQQLEEALRDMSRWIREKLTGFIREPAAEGGAGYVLTTNGAGGRSWEKGQIADVESTVKEVLEAAMAGSEFSGPPGPKGDKGDPGTTSWEGLSDKPFGEFYGDNGAVTIKTIDPRYLPERVEKVKLWENASPSSEFTQQNIAVNIAEYDGIEILFDAFNGYRTSRQGYWMPGSENINLIATESDWSLGYGYFVSRRAGVTANNVNFGNCYASNNSAKNNRMIPLAIYGIKGVE